MCVLRTQLTTATKAIMMQTKKLQRSIVVQQLDGVVDDVALQRSSAASSFSSLVVSWMAQKSTADPSYDGLMKHKKKWQHD